MGHADSQVITLGRAGRAADLWPALEAAQYGHVVQADEEAASEPVDHFLGALADIIEDWEGTAEAQAGLMRRLDAELSELERAGCHVHSAVIRHEVSPPDGEPVEIPVALLHIGPHPDETLELALPSQMTASED